MLIVPAFTIPTTTSCTLLAPVLVFLIQIMCNESHFPCRFSLNYLLKNVVRKIRANCKKFCNNRCSFHLWSLKLLPSSTSVRNDHFSTSLALYWMNKSFDWLENVSLTCLLLKTKEFLLMPLLWKSLSSEV